LRVLLVLHQNMKHQCVLEPNVKMTFLSLISFTALALAVHVLVVCTKVLGHEHCSDDIKNLLSVCMFTWKVGFMAVVTLNVGKALNILQLAKTLGG
jgi:hypothetical protein